MTTQPNRRRNPDADQFAKVSRSENRILGYIVVAILIVAAMRFAGWIV